MSRSGGRVLGRRLRRETHRRPLPGGGERRAGVAPGRERMWQDNAAVDPRGDPATPARERAAQRPRGDGAQRGCADRVSPPQRRGGVPGVQPVAQPDRGGKRAGPSPGRRGVRAPGAQARRGVAGPGGSGPARPAPARRAVGRRAAACRDRPRTGARPAAAACGRAHGPPRLHTDRGRAAAPARDRRRRPDGRRGDPRRADDAARGSHDRAQPAPSRGRALARGGASRTGGDPVSAG